MTRMAMGGEMKDMMGPTLWTPSYQDWCSLCKCQMVNLPETETNAEPLIAIIPEVDQPAFGGQFTTWDPF